ncbi:DUF1275 domain-containing protein [Anoxybacterium hadale]|uniref:DUF1275 domain-containing protein n=1 Tax=Anoxybacterium hadale TaxID=3408580 RepID=A0ACD1A656_9FIRM|nr:DUF1275 domain-containing protein [Clostridiales bacterium]
MKIEKRRANKKQNRDRHISESFHVAAILAISGGYMDAYTYLVRGEVFANAQTGNIVLLGIKIMDGKIAEAANYLIPIMAFAVGILMAELIRNKDSLFQRADWRQIVLIIEISALIIAAFLPVGSMDTPANTLISFVSALQMGSFRYVNGNAFVSTMCTGNLRSGTQCLYHHVFKGDKAMRTRWMHYYGIIFFFIAGAAMGAWATHQLSDGISIGNWYAAQFSGQVILGSCLLLAVAVWRVRERKGQNQRMKNRKRM